MVPCQPESGEGFSFWSACVILFEVFFDADRRAGVREPLAQPWCMKMRKGVMLKPGRAAVAVFPRVVEAGGTFLAND